MTPERWAQIKQVFGAALAEPEQDRAAFLEKACGADGALLQEVENLLAGQDSPSLTSPAEEFLKRAAAAELTTGETLAQYRVETKLGEGGMGAVYQAYDTRLHRQVALKVLPSEHLADPERRQRLMREARAASALNHPNIVTVYEIGSEHGVDFIAMEFVEGKTLHEIIPAKGLPLGKALNYAVQIASGLAKAHSASVIHRDLKPGNIMLTPDGLVKLLDFGLARRVQLGPEHDTTLTVKGEIVGTPAYMSPAQAEGKPLDARSDIFSFGVVLYQMLSGRQAFSGDSAASVLAAVLREEPPPLGTKIPRDLEKIVMRCLRKDPARRSQSMADIKVALEEFKKEAPEARTSGGRWRWMAVGVTVLVLCVALFLLLPRWRETRPPLKEVPLTSYLGYQGDPTLSPDGSQFAFVWDGGQANAPPQLYVSLVGQGTPLRLTNTPMAAAGCPAWSPDGQTIAFVRYPLGKSGGGLIPRGTRALGDVAGDLILLPALGGPERRIDEAWCRPAWSPDGKWLYFSASAGASPRLRALFVEAAGGGSKRRLTDPPAEIPGDWHPSVSPDGRRLVFVRSFTPWNQDLFVVDLGNGDTAGAPRRLSNDHINKSSPVWTTDGEDIVYVAGSYVDVRRVYRVRASGGPPAPAEDIGDYADVLAIASKGHRLAYSRSFRDVNIWRMPLPAGGGSARGAEKFLSSTRWDTTPEYSPDGTRVAFSSNRSGVSQIWVGNADGSNPVALTNFSQGIAGVPKWSPDGRTIVFDGRPDGGFADVYSIQAEGGPPQRLTDHPSDDVGPCYSTDGHWIYFASMRSGQPQIYRMPASGGEAAQITREGGFVPVASPDSKWIYYHKWGGGIWKVPADGGKETPVLDTQTVSANPFTFDVTATGIYFAGSLDPASRTEPLKLFRFSDGRTLELGRFDKPLNLGFSVSPDEKWLLYSQLDSSVDDLMLVENFH